MSAQEIQGCDQSVLVELYREVSQIREEIVVEAGEYLSGYLRFFTEGKASTSAINLSHYITLRRRDLRGLQERLAAVGLSSLGRGEAHVLDSLERILNLLGCALGKEPLNICSNSLWTGRYLLAKRTDVLFGKRRSKQAVRIMVTLPTEAASDPAMVRNLLEQGMDCARINCAHDSAEVWVEMISHIRTAAQQTGLSCRIMMDLAGHKLRTGPVADTEVKHIKTLQDAMGRITAPAELLLCAGERSVLAQQPGPYVAIPVDMHASLDIGDQLAFTDSRGRKRMLVVASRSEQGEWRVSCDRNIWLPQRVELTWRGGSERGRKILGKFYIDPFKGIPSEILLKPGDLLLLRNDQQPGYPAAVDRDGRDLLPAAIGITLTGVLDLLPVGADVWLDDGKIGGCIEEIKPEGALMRVSHTGPKGARLKADKGINFPGVDLSLPALSEKDYRDLDFICEHADMVGFSFVESLADMEVLLEALNERGASQLPVVAKIETERAVRNLPEIMLGTIGRRELAVMIARGDLAVELGNNRLAEVQEELLWLCEAAHVPVIWATQVLETLVKKGIRSRPEFTDAAMSGRAECVMLNKGPFVIDAVEALSNVLVRMEAHQSKKMSRLRALHW